MPITPTFPGVYIEEIPSGVHTITGVATSIAAFVDGFTRGPLDTAVQLFSAAGFEREFGGLNTLSEASYGIQQFFLNGGSEAWVVRVGKGAAGAQVTLQDKTSTGASSVVTVTAGRQVDGGSVQDPGDWGNHLFVEIDYDTSDPSELFNLRVSEITVVAGKPVVGRSETFRNVTLRNGVTNSVVNAASQLVQLSLPAGVTFPNPFVKTFRPAPTGTLGSALPTAPSMPADGATFKVDPGTGAVTATITYAPAPAPTDYPGLRPFLEAAIRAAAPTDPLLAGASVKIIGKGTAAAPYQYLVLAGRGGPIFSPDTILTFATGATANALGLTASPAPPAVANVQFYTVGSGTRGAQTGAVTGADGSQPDAPALLGNQAAKTGLFALEKVDLFNILCIPRAAALGVTDFGAVVAAAEAYVVSRRAFMIVDIPTTVTTLPQMQTWMSQNDTLRSKNAAVYFPAPQIPDPLNGFILRSVGASGTMAGLYAATDAARGVWKAPAGVDATLGNVQALGTVLTDAENGAINPLGINALRRFPVYGFVSWGARTLQGADVAASEWKYVPVRRLALYLEESLYRGTKWVVFEPNDAPLWGQIRLNVGAFMHDLFRQGAFQGASPREAYFVKCDGETTTQTDIDHGIVNVLVGFAPLKPAEFVIIQIQQIAGQIQT